MKLLSLVIIAFSLCIIGCSPKKEQTNDAKEDAITLDKITLVKLSGEPVNIRELENKTVFINFWATWCKPCLMEMPSIAKAKEQLKDKAVVFLFASNETLDVIMEFKEKRNFDFDYVHLENLEALNIQALPTTFIFNPQGELIFSEAGYRDWNTPENITLINQK